MEKFIPGQKITGDQQEEMGEAQPSPVNPPVQPETVTTVTSEIGSQMGQMNAVVAEESTSTPT